MACPVCYFTASSWKYAMLAVSYGALLIGCGLLVTGLTNNRSALIIIGFLLIKMDALCHTIMRGAMTNEV